MSPEEDAAVEFSRAARALEITNLQASCVHEAFKKFAVWWVFNQLRMAGITGMKLRTDTLGDNTKYILYVPLKTDTDKVIFSTISITYDKLLPSLPEEFMGYGKIPDIVIHMEVRGNVGVVEVF